MGVSDASLLKVMFKFWFSIIQDFLILRQSNVIANIISLTDALNVNDMNLILMHENQLKKKVTIQIVL